MNTPSTKLRAFREALTAAMRQHHLTQADIAKIAGVSQPTISSFLAGRRGISGNAVCNLWPVVYCGFSGSTSKQ